MTEKERASGRLLILCTALLWGLTGVCVKSISWGPMSIIAVRSIISLIMLFIMKGNLHLKFSKANLFGAVMMSGASILYVIAIKLTTAGTAIVLQYIAPILVFLHAILFRGRKAKLAEILLTFAVFGGCVLSFVDNLDFSRVLGNILALGSGFFYAGQIIAMNAEDCDTQDTVIISNAICFVASIPFLFTDSLVFDVKNIVWLLILAIFQYGLANILFSIGIKRTDPVEASLLLSIEPVFNPIPVAIFCGEMMTPLAIAGSVIVIAAVTLHGLLPQLQERAALKRERGKP